VERSAGHVTGAFATALRYLTGIGVARDEMMQINLQSRAECLGARDVRRRSTGSIFRPRAIDEIRRAVDEIRAYPLPIILRGPDDFAMPACRREMARARDILDHGRRFAIVDRLPLAEMNADEATAIYWLLFEHGVAAGRAETRRHDDL